MHFAWNIQERVQKWYSHSPYIKPRVLQIYSQTTIVPVYGLFGKLFWVKANITHVLYDTAPFKNNQICKVSLCGEWLYYNDGKASHNKENRMYSPLKTTSTFAEDKSLFSICWTMRFYFQFLCSMPKLEIKLFHVSVSYFNEIFALFWWYRYAIDCVVTGLLIF